MRPFLPDFPLGVELECSSAARTPTGFVAEIRGDEPEIDAKLRI